MSLSADSVVVQDSEPIAAAVDGEVVMLSERAGAYFGLNGVGSEIWNLVAQPRSVDEICQSLSGLYQIDSETLAREVVKFIDELVARKLVRIVEAPEGG